METRDKKRQQDYPAAIGLEWQVHIPSRCVQLCGRWWQVWSCSQHVPAAGWCSAPDTGGEVRSRHARTPAAPVRSLECALPRHPPGHSVPPGRRSTQVWCRQCSAVGPTTDVFPRHSDNTHTIMSCYLHHFMCLFHYTFICDEKYNREWSICM